MIDANWVALDTDCLVFLVEAMSPSSVNTTSRDIEEQRMALWRSFIYRDQLFYLLPTVREEINKVGDPDKGKLQYLVSTCHMLDVMSIDDKKVVDLVPELLVIHGKYNDCKILAEARIGNVRTLLTFDSKFKRRLENKTSVEILTPSEYWVRLAIPKGAEPKRVPADSNPASKSDIWRW